MLKRLVRYLLPKQLPTLLPCLCIVFVLLLQCKSLSAQYEYVEGFKIVVSGEKYGFIDEKGAIAIPTIYDKVQNFREGFAFVRLGMWGEIDNKGAIIIPAIYDSIRRFSSGAVVVRTGGKLGLFRRDGKEICPIVYDDIAVWYNLFIVKQSAKWGFIDQRGKVVLPIEYDTEPILSSYDLTIRKGDMTYTIDYKGDVLSSQRSDIKAASTQHR